VNKLLELAVRNLSKAEVAFEASLTGGKGQLTDAEWAELAPLPEEEESQLTEGNEGRALASCAGSLPADTDKKLLRSLRLSSLGDKVATLQWRRDAAAAEFAAKHRDLEDCKSRFEHEEAEHVVCTWNCSVRRAAPFYDKRRMHETKVDAQLSVLSSIERRLQHAKQSLAAIAGPGQMPFVPRRSVSSWQADELSLQSFEISGGEPGRDEFMSCCSSDLSTPAQLDDSSP